MAPALFNPKLADWLIYHNTQRPHHRLGQYSPTILSSTSTRVPKVVDAYIRLPKSVVSVFNPICSIVEHKFGMLTDEYRSKILRILEETPDISQRDLARELGVSLGKANYCLQALIQKGLVKASNFKNSNNKKAYLYLLTRKGIAEKARATARFLERKMAEYETLQREIEQLRREVRK